MFFERFPNVFQMFSEHFSNIFWTFSEHSPNVFWIFSEPCRCLKDEKNVSVIQKNFDGIVLKFSWKIDGEWRKICTQVTEVLVKVFHIYSMLPPIERNRVLLYAYSFTANWNFHCVQKVWLCTESLIVFYCAYCLIFRCAYSLIVYW